MRDAERAHRALRDRLAGLHALESALTLHQWDERTSMPCGGRAGRDAVAAHLSGLIHDAYTDPRLADAARRVIADPQTGDDNDLARALLHRIERLNAIPGDLAAALVHARSACVRAWHAGRDANDARGWTDAFGTLLRLLIEEANAELDARAAEGGESGGAGIDPIAGGRLRVASPRDAYSVMIDRYEPGLDSAALDAIVARLYEPLRALCKGVIDRAGRSDRGGADPDLTPAGLSLPRRDQRRLCGLLRAWVGLDEDRLRVGETEHPFALLIAPGDVGLAVRHDAANAMSALYATLHESGHAQYMQNIPESLLWFGIDEEGASHGIHESQSRFWENFVGRSDAFLRRLPAVIDEAGIAGASSLVDAIRCDACRVTDTVIRIGSDELSYNLHIGFRVDLESRLVRGDLLPGDLPAAWDDACEAAIGRRPAGARDGVLQDIHWSSGIVGGFACYLMGNLYAAGLHKTVMADLGPIESLIESGQQHEIGRWLCDRIHRHGKRYPPSELYRRATGSSPAAEPSPDVKPILDYLSGKWHAT